MTGSNWYSVTPFFFRNVENAFKETINKSSLSSTKFKQKQGQRHCKHQHHRHQHLHQYKHLALKSDRGSSLDNKTPTGRNRLNLGLNWKGRNSKEERKQIRNERKFVTTQKTYLLLSQYVQAQHSFGLTAEKLFVNFHSSLSLRVFYT